MDHVDIDDTYFVILKILCIAHSNIRKELTLYTVINCLLLCEMVKTDSDLKECAKTEVIFSVLHKTVITILVGG